MLHMDGADASTTFTDSSSSGKTITAVNQAQIDTAQSKFGGASGLFDGTGDSITAADSADWDFGTADFTIDFWHRRASASNEVLFDIGNGGAAGGKGVLLYFTDTKQMQVYVNGTALTAANLIFSEATWYHFAITRSGGTLRLFQDGTSVANPADTSDITGSTAGLRIGLANSAGFGALDTNGHIDEFRIVKGTAVWTANFTPPSAPYTQVPIVVSGGSAPVIRKRRNMMGVGL
jgi:hypothetical protein